MKNFVICLLVTASALAQAQNTTGTCSITINTDKVNAFSTKDKWFEFGSGLNISHSALVEYGMIENSDNEKLEFLSQRDGGASDFNVQGLKATMADVLKLKGYNVCSGSDCQGIGLSYKVGRSFQRWDLGYGYASENPKYKEFDTQGSVWRQIVEISVVSDQKEHQQLGRVATSTSESGWGGFEKELAFRFHKAIAVKDLPTCSDLESNLSASENK